MDERRRSQRYPVGDVTGVLRVTSAARLRGLSPSQVRLEARTQVGVGRTADLTLRLSDGAEARLAGTVRSCRLGEGERAEDGRPVAVYEAVVGLSVPLPTRVGEIVASCRRTDDEAPAALLAERGLLGTITLDTAYQFTVRTLSLHGALIEADRSFLTGSLLDTEVRLGEVPLRLRARVVFSREGSEGGHGATAHQHGIEFVGPSESDQRAIEQFFSTRPS